MQPRAANAAVAAIGLIGAIAVIGEIGVLGACGNRRDEEPAPAPAAGSEGSARDGASAGPVAGALRPVAELREHAILVEGTRRIALWVAAGGWYEPDARGLAAQPLIGDAIARARPALGELVDAFLGAHPILTGGEEHRERTLRFTPQPRPVELPGLLLQVATAGPIELWRYEHELRTELATVDAAGALAELPALPRVGPDVPARSPVSAKACATPKVRDLASTGDAILALVTECHADAPVRIATYRWPAPASPAATSPGAAPPAPAVATTTLPPLGQLDLQVDRLLATRAGAPILVGRRGETAIALRIGPDGTPVASLGPRGVDAVSHAAVADDGAVWTRSVGRGPDGRDRIVVARDGAPVAVTSPTGAPLRPEALAFDERLGVVVLALDGATGWLLAERPPPGPPRALPPPAR